MRAQSQRKRYRFSGHESFVCRYTWLPKAVNMLSDNPRAFANEDEAMVCLGVGKNMVRSIRFWADVFGVTESRGKGGIFPTEFGNMIFDKKGHDPFLEDDQTLWLLHWKLSTQFEEPLFAWHYLLNRWHEPDFTKLSVLASLEQEVVRQERKLSRTTLVRHLDTFIHTYVPTRTPKEAIREENLDCPLVELELLRRVGDRETDEGTGKREPIYAFRFEQKPEISSELFVYCLADFFSRKHPTEFTLPFREVATGHGSPGQIFKLPEIEIRERLESLQYQTDELLVFEESTNIQQVRRQEELPLTSLLRSVYERELVHV